METIFFHNLQQCCRSGSGLDPASMRSLDPDPDSESGSDPGQESEEEKNVKIEKK